MPEICGICDGTGVTCVNCDLLEGECCCLEFDPDDCTECDGTGEVED